MLLVRQLMLTDNPVKNIEIVHCKCEKLLQNCTKRVLVESKIDNIKRNKVPNWNTVLCSVWLDVPA